MRISVLLQILSKLDEIRSRLAYQYVCSRSARDLDGRYCWIVAPVVEHGQAQLLRDNKPTVPHDIWHKVDDAGIRRLVAEVNAYYDAVAGQPTGKTPRRAVNSSS
jgi:hypothetical protein